MTRKHTASPAPLIDGTHAADCEIDEEAVYQRMAAAYAEVAKRQRKRERQRIRFERGPVCLVEVADIHLGNPGTNIVRAFEEAKVIAETPGMYLVLNGDLIDNFILSKIAGVRFQTISSIPEEWALIKKYLRAVGQKLVVSVSGNHEGWMPLLAGVDYFRDVLAQLVPTAIYDAYDTRFSLEIGEEHIPCRVRHLWRGNSIYNLTHAIERASFFDGDFRIGFGAHTHASGVYRQFNAGGATGHAVLAGSYKRVDEYAERKGFSKPNGNTAISIIFDGGCIAGYENLSYAADLMGYLCQMRHITKGGKR